MKITLESNPSDVPCGVKIVAADGRSVISQTDFDWPGIASSFGFSISNVLNAAAPKCEHLGTDGTVDCPECGFPAGSFIHAARAWLDNNDGESADDPGYFN